MLPTGLLLALFAALGLIVGSFLNVCSDRLPTGRSIVYPPSTCATCNHRLSARDLVPLFSYLWLRGRCRYCHTPIPHRLPAAELATAEVLQELLEVADNFDRALEHAGDDVPESFLVGMRLTQQGLHDLLDRRGVVRFQSVGERFDPQKHEALASQPAPDSEPNVILQEVQAGYMMGERVLRPAKVVVSRAE